MKQYQINFENKDSLTDQLTEIKLKCETSSFKNIIFYLTWTQSSKDEIYLVTNTIERLFPDCAYYGNESSGNIAMGRFTYGTHITCYAFEGNSTETELVWVEKGTEISSLEDLWKYCRTKKDLCGIELIPAFSYVEELKIDRNEPDIDSSILIFGGASVNYDAAIFGADIIAKGHPMTREGMAVMLYYGTDLKFRSCDILGWKGLGKLMEVTKSTGKELIEIDNVPAYSVYEKYLNLTIDDKDTLVFPLIAEEDGNEFIRTPQIIQSDRSMRMFADIPEGTHVRISYGDKNTILNSINDKAMEIAEYRPEAIKAYSCAGRRLFWGDSEVGKETSIFQNIAPVCGFYTGGEILRFGKKLRVLNQTLALVFVREGEGKEKNLTYVLRHEKDKSLLTRLTYFAERIVDEEMEAKSQLSEALKKAEVANKSKSSFLFNMSHDIRTPMNAINGFSAIARKNSKDSKKVKDCLDKIDIASQQMLGLINQVLEMARIESGKIEFDEKRVNVQKEFESMVTILSEQAKSVGLIFKFSISEIEHPTVLADEARLSSVTMNITGNALKYTPAGGTIDFRLKEIPARKPGKATFVFTVADTGIGMSREYLKKLYEPFSREKNSTVSKIQGTGLGLSIVKSTIDLMGGNIDVKSELGKGTQFDITVDLTIAEDIVEKKEEVKTVSFRGKRVLLVEDNEMNREIAKELLEEQKFIIEYAEDGDVAVDMVLQFYDSGNYNHYDFILMDVQMPRMNGYEATRKIREYEKLRHLHVPIIAMTANAFEEDRQNALESGMDDHLAKPIEVHKLFRTISKYV